MARTAFTMALLALLAGGAVMTKVGEGSSAREMKTTSLAMCLKTGFGCRGR